MSTHHLTVVLIFSKYICIHIKIYNNLCFRIYLVESFPKTYIVMDIFAILVEIKNIFEYHFFVGSKNIFIFFGRQQNAVKPYIYSIYIILFFFISDPRSDPSATPKILWKFEFELRSLFWWHLFILFFLFFHCFFH